MGKEFRILITDDDPVILYMHKHLIKKSGLSADTISFPNAEDTLAYIGSHSPEINYLIILDINMPGMSGWDLLDKIIEKNYKDIFVVIVSSSVDTEDHEKAKTYSQIIAFIEKPLSDPKILTLLESHSYKNSWQNKSMPSPGLIV